jgi:hypothetical protein
MPIISNTPELTKAIVGNSVTLTVKYTVVFTVFERHLAALGLKFRERIDVFGVDDPGAATSAVVASFPSRFIAVTDGAAPQTIVRNASIVVPRAQLDEDASPILPPDFIPDEIQCGIRYEAVGLPLAVTQDVLTNQMVLGGLVSTGASAGASS